MEDNELRDIILEKSDEQRSIKIKKLLMFVAMFFILFLIVLIAMKILNSDYNATGANNQDARLVLPPEPEIVKDTKGGDELFQQVPIIPENKGQDSFEDMVKSLKDKESQRQTEQTASQSQEPTPNVQELIKQQQSVELDKQDKEQPKQTAKSEPKVSSKEQIKPEQKTATKQDTKVGTKVVKEQPKQLAKPEPKVIPKEHNKSAQSVSSGNYIQIVAVKNFNENAAEIKKLKSNGYSYKLHKVNVKGVEMTKIVVGPYSSESIKNELAKIKSNVATGAFIVNIK
jgi:ABC transporter, ATP-binding protein